MSNFSLERLAIHVVDRRLDSPVYATEEFNLEPSTGNTDDIRIIHEFFEEHLENAWESSENTLTRAASFNIDSSIRAYYQELVQDTSQFLRYSCEIAELLYGTVRGTSASPGILAVIWFRENADERPFLGLFKMDPGNTDLVTLRQAQGDDILPDLAVASIEQALPDSASSIQKWAILPHPTRRSFDLKVRDKSAAPDLTQYFVKFLGCDTKLSEQRQAHMLISALREYIWRFYPDNGVALLTNFVSALASEKEITNGSVINTNRELGILSHFDETAFEEILRGFNVDRLHTFGSVLRRVKYRYRLRNGIEIVGPWDQIFEAVQAPAGSEGEFRVQAHGYDEDYV